MSCYHKIHEVGKRMQKKYKAKKDQYTKARGGYSTLLSISCNKCRQEVLLYQKDGPGQLLRMYLDKIMAPKDLVSKVSKYKTKSRMTDLACPSCKRVLAAPVLYEKEKRLAYRLFVGAIRKSDSKGIFPKE